MEELEKLGYKLCSRDIWIMGDFYMKLEVENDKPCYLCINKNSLSHYKFNIERDADCYEIEVPCEITFNEHMALHEWITSQQKEEAQ